MTEKDNTTNQNSSIEDAIERFKALDKKAINMISNVHASIVRAQRLCRGEEDVHSRTYEMIREYVMSARQVDTAVQYLASEMEQVVFPKLENTPDFKHYPDTIMKRLKQASDANLEMYRLAEIIAGWCDVTFPKPSANR
jgi:cell fate (sporulation/competence/biofilm development) regulator YmcA (YheA/YmcA/DUF963 family)